MTQDPMHDDSSHYEISLTATQAFTAFVLILLSLAASFAFGVVIGKGREVPVTQGTASTPKLTEGNLAVAGAPEIEAPEQRVTSASASEPQRTPSPQRSPKITEQPAPRKAAPSPVVLEASTEPVPHVAQLLSTQEAKPAEALAARLIEDGFKTAYVERVRGESGMIYRVRVEYPSEAAAREAVAKLKPYAPGTVWVSRK